MDQDYSDVIGTDKDDYIVILPENNTITGREGKDIYVYDWRSQHKPVTITDFNPSEDIIIDELISTAIFSYNDDGDLTIRQKFGLFDKDKDMLIIKNGEYQDLNKDNFIMVNAYGESIFINGKHIADHSSSEIIGTDKDDYIVVLSGNKTITGGEGKDIFYYNWPDKFDSSIITDCNPNEDKFLIHNFVEYFSIDKTNEGYAQINFLLNDDKDIQYRLILKDVMVSELNNDNITFAESWMGSFEDIFIV